MKESITDLNFKEKFFSTTETVTANLMLWKSYRSVIKHIVSGVGYVGLNACPTTWKPCNLEQIA